MKLVFTLSLIFFSLNIIAQKPTTAIQDQTVATVNGEKISQSQLEIYHRARLLQFSNREITKIKSLGDLINREITLQRAKKAGLQNDPAVKDQMENALFQAQIAKDLNPNFIKIKVTDEEIKTYYQENPEFRTSLILLRLPAQPTPEQVKASYERAISIYQKVREAPQNFDQIAKEYSQLSPDINPNTPDIGFQPARQLSPEYFEAIKSKSIGNIVMPFRTQFGFNIVKITGKKEFSQIDLDLYNAILFDLKKQKIIDQYFEKLAEQSKIKINESLVK